MKNLCSIRSKFKDLSKISYFCILFISICNPTFTLAVSLSASDATNNDQFGWFVSISGNNGLVAARYDDVNFTDQGSAYIFRNLHTATGSINENAKLIASDGMTSDFIWRVSLSGTLGLLSSVLHNIGSNTDQGAAYVFRNLDTATGTVTEHAKLTSTDGQAFDRFGYGLSVSGTIGLVGSVWSDIGSNTDQGAAYVFRNLDTATGTVNQNVKLVASDGAANDNFGYSASISGTIGLVGALADDIGSNTDQGSAYVFRNLDTATGTVNQNAKLVASDGAASDLFGQDVSISGNIGLVGAHFHDIGSNTNQGAAYVFRNLNTVSGNVFENAKLVASDGGANDQFGWVVSISGNVGLVGAGLHNIGSNIDQGAAYIFRNLDTATSTVTQNVKLIASDGTANDRFGISNSIDGDRFIIGANGKNNSQGKAYSGAVRTFTTANLGNDSTATDGLSFISWENWIIGQTTSNNTVTLSSGDSGNFTVGTNQVYVGQNTGSNNNTLHVQSGATLTSNSINVGASGNSGNQLRANGTINLSSGSVLNVFDGNILSGAGTIQGHAGNTTNNVVISGSLRPGSGNLGSGIGTLTRNNGNVTWNGNASSPWVFELGLAQATMLLANTGGTRDLLDITGGDFLKGTGSSFVFDFNGTGAAGWYKLVDWTGTTTFSVTNFSAINITPSVTSYSFHIDNGGGSTTALYIYMIPEPQVWALLTAVLCAVIALRHLPHKAARPKSTTLSPEI